MNCADANVEQKLTKTTKMNKITALPNMKNFTHGVEIDERSIWMDWDVNKTQSCRFTFKYDDDYKITYDKIVQFGPGTYTTSTDRRGNNPNKPFNTTWHRDKFEYSLADNDTLVKVSTGYVRSSLLKLLTPEWIETVISHSIECKRITALKETVVPTEVFKDAYEPMVAWDLQAPGLVEKAGLSGPCPVGKFFDDKGFGFISDYDLTDGVFFHVKDCNFGISKYVKPRIRQHGNTLSCRLVYKVEKTAKGLAAKQIENGDDWYLERFRPFLLASVKEYNKVLDTYPTDTEDNKIVLRELLKAIKIIPSTTQYFHGFKTKTVAYGENGLYLRQCHGGVHIMPDRINLPTYTTFLERVENLTNQIK